MNAALSLSPTKTYKKESITSNSSTTPPKINFPLFFKKSYSPNNPTINQSNSLKFSLSSKTRPQKLMTWPQVDASLICSRHQSRLPSESLLPKRTKCKTLITSTSVNLSLKINSHQLRQVFMPVSPINSPSPKQQNSAKTTTQSKTMNLVDRKTVILKNQQPKTGLFPGWCWKSATVYRNWTGMRCW